MVELREAQQAAARTRIRMQYVLKEARVFDIWSKTCPVMLSDAVLSEAKMVCKGGTSLNKVYLGHIQRFSEDIDLDIFFKDDRSKDEKIEFIKNNVIAPLSSSYTIPKEARRKNIIHFTCKFKNEINMDDSVFLEFNMGEAMTGSDQVISASSTILPLTVGKVPVYSLHTLIAKKLKAFYERDEGKDVYDIYSGLKITSEIGTIIEILKDVLISADIKYDDFRARMTEKFLDGQKMKGLHGSTNPYVPKGLRVGWDVAAKEILGKIGPHL